MVHPAETSQHFELNASVTVTSHWPEYYPQPVWELRT